MLERRIEGESFRTLEWMDAPAAGLASAVDNWPVARAEYRLRLERRDGRVAFTEALSVSCDCDRPYVEVAPHPVVAGTKAQIHFFQQGESDELRVYDMQGRLLWDQRMDGGRAHLQEWQVLELPTTAWPAGIYFIHTTHGQVRKMLIRD